MANPPPSEGLEHSPARDLQRRLRGGTRYLRRREVARAAKVSLHSARKLWRALGFPGVSDEDLAFTLADLGALNRVVGLVRDGLLDEETAIALARALGQTTDRLVSWQVEALVENLADDPAAPEVSRGEISQEAADRVVERIAALADDLEELLVYAWRRQLAAAVSRLSGDTGEPEYPASAEITVGFADLVEYTKLSHELDRWRLAVVVQRFQALASDVITAGGGRVVKTVGDEVLFTADDPAAGAVIALSLAERMAMDDVLPDVRVGLAYGPVLRSLGDVYGVPVNLASRLTALAQPGTVLTDPATAARLSRHSELVLHSQRSRKVQGFGDVAPVLITEAHPDTALIPLD